VAAIGPSEIVNKSESSPDFNIGVVIIERFDFKGQAHRIGKDAGVGIVKRRTIDVNLSLVEEIRVENVLEGQKVIGRVIDDAHFVEQSAIWSVRKGDIALGAAIEGRLVAKFVIYADQRRIFVNGCCGSVSK
jgi:hypothetical protein